MCSDLVAEALNIRVLVFGMALKAYLRLGNPFVFTSIFIE